MRIAPDAAARVADVAVFLPVAGTFSYHLPSHLTAGVGSRVWVPFGSRGVEGVVVALRDEAPTRAMKTIARVLEAPSPTEELLQLGAWVADYYLAPPGEALRLLLPSGGRAKASAWLKLTDAGERAAAGIGQALEPLELAGVELRERLVLEKIASRHGQARVAYLARFVDGAAAAAKVLEARGLVQRTDRVRAKERSSTPPSSTSTSTPSSTSTSTSNVQLNVEQRQALAAIVSAIDRQKYAPFLLHGVTGSGKTEVYLHAIAHALAQGRGALALVPEISLTPQLAERFRARFGDGVAVLHSGLTDAQRFDAWVRIRRGEARIALGARSAVFAPIANLGIIVVDEEHDSSFKQEEGVRYHGRDVAMRRARQFGATVVLGSATPSIETYEAACDGRFTRLELPNRATPRPLPQVEVIDLRQHKLAKGDGEPGLLAAPLLRAVEETLAAREQAILFLNRRGYSTFVLCTACGHRFTCRDCAVTLTYHRGVERLACHYCGYLEPAPSRCPKCQLDTVEKLGMGTERIETLLREQFPNAKVARLDRDSAQGSGLERVLDGLRAREIDLVVGTQMITKGHDFPGVTLVGVVLADYGMGLPDFRATERTFQLLEQVAGRAGRGERPGRVIIQTYSPNHAAVLRACDHNYRLFFDTERAQRRELGYPPFARLGLLRFDGADGLAVRRTAEQVTAHLRSIAAQAPPEADLALMGPAEAPLGRLKGKVRWQLLVKAGHARALRTLLLSATSDSPSVRMTVDVDPMSML